MDLGKYSILFGISTIKFMFAPFGGPKAELSFLETYFSCVAGALLSASIFFFLSEYFMKRAHEKRVKQYLLSQANGTPLPKKKKFTRMNKFVVRMKLRFGIYGIAMFAPLFLSVPLGSIVTAKFYGKLNKTFPIIILGMFTNGLITTGLAYLFFA
jgi:hypothetical protein